MGQYYRPEILRDSPTPDGHEVIDFAFYSHNFGNGLKLMEHSYVGNDFVNVVAGFLKQPRRLVWAGDYADAEPGRTIVSDGREFDANLYALASEHNTRPYVVASGEPAMDQSQREYSDRRGADYGVDKVNVEATVDVAHTVRYFLNHSKREFVDVTAGPPANSRWSELIIHPLPLLTSEGNGRGGGDYHSYDFVDREIVYHRRPGHDLVGSWARDVISGSDERPGAEFTEIKPGFSEDPAKVEKEVSA